MQPETFNVPFFLNRKKASKKPSEIKEIREEEFIPPKITRKNSKKPEKHKFSYHRDGLEALDETNRSQLLRWAYREQVRRHHEEARRDERTRDG